MSKQSDISSFFGKAPAAKPASKQQPLQDDGAKENRQQKQQQDAAAASKRAGPEPGGGGGQRLKRLKRSSEADGTQAHDEQQLQDADLMDDELADAEPPPATAAADAPAADGAPAADDAPSPAAAAAGSPAAKAVVPKQQAAAAFNQLFASGKAKAAAGGKGKAGGSKGKAGGGGGAKSPAKAAAPKRVDAPQSPPQPSASQQQQQQPAAEAAAAGAATPSSSKHQQEGQPAAAAAAAATPSSNKQERPERKPRRRPAAPAAAAADDDDSDAGDAGDGDGKGDEAGEQQAADSKAAFKQPPAGKKGGKAAGGQLEGVGTGALAAAKQAVAADIQGLITWKAGGPVPYSFLVDTFQAIASTTKRLEIIGLLTSTFRALLAASPADLLASVYLCTNRVAPAHAGVELGVGDAILIRAVAAASGRKEASIKADYEAEGDLGCVAAACKSSQRTMFKPAPLTVAGVLKTFREIAHASGQASQEKKRNLVTKLLAASTDAEPGYIIRSLQGKLRIGLAEQSVLVALAHAALLHKDGAKDTDGRLADRLEAAAQAVKAAYSECPSYDVLVPALLNHPLAELSAHVHFMPGVPVRPMLAKPTTGVGEVLDKFGNSEFTCEYKYDGERVQIHVLQGGKRVHIYSRNAEDMTKRYPDITSRVPAWLAPGTDSIVIDGEAVAWDLAAGKILPFQVLSTRARKDVALADVKVAVCVYAFDCLYLNGTSLLKAPLTQRRDALRASLVEAPGQLALATAKTSADVEELGAFLNEAVDAATEGLIVKTLADGYEPSKRSSHWLKLKKDYLAGVGDTFDVVPIGGFYGKGKRAGVFGAYLLAVYDPDQEAYQTISKLGTGFSEEQLASLADSLRPAIIPQPRPYYQYGESGAPDVWFEPVAVWEVKAADLSISPLHQAARGLVEHGKGISIRFPRLVRVREDKGPEDATTASQVAEMYRQQAVVAAERSKADAAGDDE